MTPSRPSTLVASFEFPDFEQSYEYVAMRAAEGYPLEAGTVISSNGLDFPAARFSEHVIEEHVAHSNALHAHLRRRRPVRRRPAGPLHAEP